MRPLGWIVLFAAACGASPPREPSDRADHAELVRRAAGAWAATDPAAAARLAERARQLGAGDDAREIAARSHAMLGRYPQAIDATAGTSDPEILLVRAHAQIALGRFSEALATIDLAARHLREPDPWIEEVRPALEASQGRPLYERSGTASPLALEDLPLPVVRVRADAFEALALVGTGASFVVVDPSLRAHAGVFDELVLGRLTIRNVPHTVRPLEPVREALGAPVQLVLGAELLCRVFATIDGPSGRLEVHPIRPSREAVHDAPLWTPSGSFLAVPAEIAGARALLTLDSTGLYPLAVAPDADPNLGFDALSWASAGDERTVAALPAIRLGTLLVEGLPAVRGLLGPAHARAANGPIAGSLGWQFLRELRVAFDCEGRRLRFE